eukprot:scaffold35831_cov13-Tisochrysis_lutea.AAC.1
MSTRRTPAIARSGCPRWRAGRSIPATLLPRFRFTRPAHSSCTCAWLPVTSDTGRVFPWQSGRVQQSVGHGALPPLVQQRLQD